MASNFKLIIDGSPDGLPHAAPYYKFFPREPSPAGALTLASDTTVVMTRPSFETLMDEVIKAGSKSVIMVVCHAFSGGMLLRLTTQGGKFAQKESLDLIDTVMAVEDEADQIKQLPEKSDAEKQAKTARWKKLFDRIAPGKVVGSFSLKEALDFYHKWLDLNAQALNLTGLPPRDTLRRLIGKVKQLRALGIARLELRACNLGGSDETMKAVKKFFNCGQLVAPDAETFYLGALPVFTMNQLADFFLRKAGSKGHGRVPGPQGRPALNLGGALSALETHNTRIFRTKFVIPIVIPRTGISVSLLPPIFALTVDELKAFHYEGFASAASRTDSATPNWDNVRDFVERFIMPASSYKSGPLPVAGFWTPGKPPFILPNEPEYLEKLKQV